MRGHPSCGLSDVWFGCSFIGWDLLYYYVPAYGRLHTFLCDRDIHNVHCSNGHWCSRVITSHSIAEYSMLHLRGYFILWGACSVAHLIHTGYVVLWKGVRLSIYVEYSYGHYFRSARILGANSDLDIRQRELVRTLCSPTIVYIRCQTRQWTMWTGWIR